MTLKTRREKLVADKNAIKYYHNTSLSVGNKNIHIKNEYLIPIKNNKDIKYYKCIVSSEWLIVGILWWDYTHTSHNMSAALSLIGTGIKIGW